MLHFPVSSEQISWDSVKVPVVWLECLRGAPGLRLVSGQLA